LSYLRRFPFDKIKIDQSFVEDEGAANIVTAVIGLACSLNLKVIAEGVESEEQLNRLRERHCDQAQGFFFGLPLPAGELERAIAEWEECFDPDHPFLRPLTMRKRKAFA
jgi:EAL domain-containing protein (putative c-di-GMP-specific phosphodiesterase class I)